MTSWKFLTNHGLVLLAIAADPHLTVREIAATVGITERAAHRVIAGLVASGYLERTRVGRRSETRLNLDMLHSDPDDPARAVRDLVTLLAPGHSAEPRKHER